jgi:hypothetical protein
MEIQGFIGGSNVTQSRLNDCERTINFFVVKTQSPGAKGAAFLQRTEGIKLRYDVGSDPVTATFYQDGRAFGVAGTSFLEFFDDYTAIVRGTVADDGIDVATICGNGTGGNQLFVTAGSNGYIYNLTTDAIAIIADADFPNGTAVMGEYFAGYFFVLERNSRTFYWSAIEDGTTWDALDVAERIWASDFISFLKRLGTNIWLVGTQTAEVWYATGGVEVFAPIPGVLIEHGCVARQTAQRVTIGGGDTLAWLDQSERGGGQVVVAKGYQPQDVSTYAINRIIQAEEGLMNHAVGLAMTIDGHPTYWLQLEDTSVETTLVLDLETGIWHERAHWNYVTNLWERHIALCHMFAFERHFLGSRLDGEVFEISPDYLTDEVDVAA